MSELDSLKSKFKIEDLFRINYNEKDNPHVKTIDRYTDEIGLQKPSQFEEAHRTDAQNMYLAEKLRNNNNFSIADTNFYLISSDQRLRRWDFKRNENQPVVLLPSQWMTILLKYCSRTSNDYKSFAQFLKLKTEKSIFTEHQLHAALSGISEITEDFKTQETIFERIFETKAQTIINKYSNDYDSIREEFKEIAKSEADSKIHSLEEKARKIEEQSDQTILGFKGQMLSEKKDFLGDLRKKKYPIDKVSERKFNAHKFQLFGLIFLYYLGVVLLIWKFGWDKMEPVVYVMSVLGALGSFGYIFTQENTISFPKYLDSKKEEIKNQTYRDFRFDTEKYAKLSKEVDALEKEIAD